MVEALAGSKCLVWLKVASPPALLRALHDHHRLEEPPADPGQKLTPEECAATAPAGRDLGLLSVISNSVAKSSGKFQRAEPEVGHLISIDF